MPTFASPSSRHENTREVVRPTRDWPGVCQVEPTEPFRWLALGMRDMMNAPGPSLAYGALYVVMGYLILAMASFEPRLTLAMMTGFLLVGTFLSIGFYELSQELEEDREVTFLTGFRGLRHNPASLAIFAIVLGLTMGLWFRTSALMVGMFFGSVELAVGGWGSLVGAIVNGEHGLAFIATFTATGLVFAVFAFCISVVSIPLINGRKVDVVRAVVTSLRAVRHNPAAMVIWAALIALLIGAGMVTLLAGLVFTLPLIGHASWHAYREIVEDENLPEA